VRHSVSEYSNGNKSITLTCCTMPITSRVTTLTLTHYACTYTNHPSTTPGSITLRHWGQAQTYTVQTIQGHTIWGIGQLIEALWCVFTFDTALIVVLVMVCVTRGNIYRNTYRVTLNTLHHRTHRVITTPRLHHVLTLIVSVQHAVTVHHTHNLS